MNAELPNGLHDAEILEFTYSIGKKTLSFSLDVWIGDMEQPTTLRERYRVGVLVFEGVQFFTKSEPEGLSDEGLQFLDWSLEEDLQEKAKLPDTFKGLLFNFYALSCSMGVACTDVYFQWIAGSETNRSPYGE